MGGVLGLRPQPADAYRRSEAEKPSFAPSALSLSSSKLTEFAELTFARRYAGDKRILVLGTSQFLLPCVNGTFFNTGHHSTETLLPMYHLDKAGFEFDIATADGAPLALEEWTFPLAVGYEAELRQMQDKVREKLARPLRFEDVPEALDSYAAVFLPGGHGPLIDMHTHASLGRLLRSAHERGVTTVSLCHGPSGLRAAAVDGEFPYRGYKICVFPDSMDRLSPKLGYLPGRLAEEYQCEAKLAALGCLVQNRKMDDSVVVDRELVTGASQLAAQKTAEVVVRLLAEKFDFEVAAGQAGVGRGCWRRA